jgi:hypothetical protein
MDPGDVDRCIRTFAINNNLMYKILNEDDGSTVGIVIRLHHLSDTNISIAYSKYTESIVIDKYIIRKSRDTNKVKKIIISSVAMKLNTEENTTDSEKLTTEQEINTFLINQFFKITRAG